LDISKLAVAAVITFGGLHGATAATFKPFTAAAFKAAEHSGRPIVVEVYAPWCPICACQQPILEELEANPTYARVTVLRVNFDSPKDVLRDLNVAMQSTLIGFHGSVETERLAGVIRKPNIEALFASTLKS
jgi:thiol-disulfide isomerase/thioredoxin